jgi:hypothetical protein
MKSRRRVQDEKLTKRNNPMAQKRKHYFWLVPLILVVLLVLFHGQVLKGLGAFLAPAGEREGDAVVLEGTQVLINHSVKQGVALLKEGRVKRMYIVLHLLPREQQLFAIQEEYAGILGKELERLGAKRGQYRVLLAPIEDHPITLAEARYAVPYLFRDGVKKAILLAEGFHTRRSLWTYQRMGNSLGIRFVPVPCFPSYPKENWWKHLEGIKDFSAESVKLGYYLVRGYLPVSSFWN